MRNFERTRKGIFSNWLTGVAAGAMIVCLSTAALADAGDSNRSAGTLAAASTAGPIEEVNRYYLRLMTQIFDGSKDFSHTQIAGFARMRKDRQSWTMLDFGDGAVVISARDKLSASAFENISGTDLGVLYDYNSKRIAGTSSLAKFHNDVVRPHLDKAPALGSDADWSASLPAGTLGISALSGAAVRLDLSRRYFMHDGKPMVLVEYRVPVASFDAASGGKVMHWGRGFALSDPGFGTIYANVALHRSATTASDGSIRPYRFFRAAFASDDKGKPMIDIARIPQVAAFYNDFFGKAALEVIPYSDEGLAADQTPVKLAANLDIIAMSIGENGANDNGALAGAQTGGNRGVEKPKSLPQIPAFGQSEARRAADAVGARAATDASLPSSTPRSPGMTTAAHEAEHVSGPRPVEPERPVLTPEEALEEALQRQEAQKKIPGTRGGGGGGGSGGGGGNGSGQGGSNGGGSVGGGLGDGVYNALASETASEIGGNVNTGVTIADKTTSIAGAIVSLNTSANAFESRLLSLSESMKSTAASYSRSVKDYERLVNTTIDSNKIADKSAEAAYFASKYLQYEKEFKTVLAETSVLGKKAKELIALTGDVSPSKIKELLEKIPGPANKILLGVNVSLNAVNTGKAIKNTYDAQLKDLSQGQQLELNRKYVSGSANGLDNFESLRDLGLDVLGLAIDAGSGNVVGAVSGGVSLLTQSLSDLAISAKGVLDTRELNHEINQEALRLLTMRIEKEDKARDKDLAGIDASLAETRKELDELKVSKPQPDRRMIDTNDPRWDPVTGLPKKLEYWEWLKKNNRGALIHAGINPDAPAGHTGPWPIADDPAVTATKPPLSAAEKRRIEQEKLRNEIIAANESLEEAFKPDYPTAARDAKAKQPIKVTKPADVGPAIDPVQQAELDREARKAQAQADLDAYQAKRLAERKAEEAAQALKPRGGPFEVSSFNTKPVTFEPVTFSGVDFDKDGDLFERNADGTTSLKKVGPDPFVSPTFVGPEFNAPKASGLGWTNFDDDDYPGSGEVPAFGFESMSGKIATDLSKWADWLATQDMRQLERLARTAGYPNLASALNDAANLIRLSQDKGYVKWAMTAPSCGGYVGCGPSYSERWGMKISTVKLGNILNQSRDVFSTGGLSDIAISGGQLAYILTDFGLQDGDVVDVLVQQFGRSIYKGRVGLTNGGQAFDIQLQRGVSVLTLTAVNEGAVSPNTAGIAIKGVTKGNASQSYSLLTGQSATLRIDTNRPAGN